jgi:hypothetical protein
MASAGVRAITQQSKRLRRAAIVPNYRHMLQRSLPAGFIAPCLPTKTDKLPSGSGWLHEIKHDGFRVIARKDGPRVRLYSRPGNDFLAASITAAGYCVPPRVRASASPGLTTDVRRRRGAGATRKSP